MSGVAEIKVNGDSFYMVPASKSVADVYAVMYEFDRFIVVEPDVSVLEALETAIDKSNNLNIGFIWSYKHIMGTDVSVVFEVDMKNRTIEAFSQHDDIENLLLEIKFNRREALKRLLDR